MSSLKTDNPNYIRPDCLKSQHTNLSMAN